MLKVLEILDTRQLYDRGMNFAQRRLHLIYNGENRAE
jgi:hypothetical protein